MYGGYGAIMTYLYPADISATANNLIMNVGKSGRKFFNDCNRLFDEQVFNECRNGLLIGDVSLSFVVMLLIPGLKEMGKKKV